MRKAGDELIPVEPGLRTEENFIFKKSSESNELADQSPFKRLRMSGSVIHQ